MIDIQLVYFLVYVRYSKIQPGRITIYYRLPTYAKMHMRLRWLRIIGLATMQQLALLRRPKEFAEEESIRRKSERG